MSQARVQNQAFSDSLLSIIIG